MFSSFADRPVHHRGRRVATAVSALTAGVALAGAPGVAGVAGAATPRSTTGATHRVVSTTEHTVGYRSSRRELQYFTAHGRYQLISQYGKNHDLDYRAWQKDKLGGTERAVAQVVVLPDAKRWSERTRGIAPLPAQSFGIESTGAQVAQAIRDGAAHEDGLGMKDGQRVRLLTLTPGTHERSALLWVNPTTLQPVAATAAYVTGSRSVRIVSSHWENVTGQVLNRIVTAPKVPAGYRVTHS